MSNGDHVSTTTVEVVLTGRRATLADIQQAIDTLRADGIPDTFEVELEQSDVRPYDAESKWEDRPPNHRFSIKAERAAVTR